MKELKFVLGTLLISSLTCQAFADPYVKLNGLLITNAGDFDNEFSPGLSIGYEFDNPAHAVELEAQVNGLDNESPGYEVDADLFVYSLNYRYIFAESSNYDFYLNLGGGTSRPEFSISPTQRVKDRISTWHIGSGVKYDLGENFFFDIGVRFQDFGEIEANGIKFDAGTPLIFGASVGLKF